VSELSLSESDGGEKKGLLEKKNTQMGVRKRLKNRKKGNIYS